MRRRANSNTETAVVLTGPIKIDGKWRNKGDELLMTTEAARDLIVTGRGLYLRSDMKATKEPGAKAGEGEYRRRDMKAG
jgi:hypothetical protein